MVEEALATFFKVAVETVEEAVGLFRKVVVVVVVVVDAVDVVVVVVVDFLVVVVVDLGETLLRFEIAPAGGGRTIA